MSEQVIEQIIDEPQAVEQTNDYAAPQVILQQLTQEEEQEQQPEQEPQPEQDAVPRPVVPILTDSVHFLDKEISRYQCVQQLKNAMRGLVDKYLSRNTVPKLSFEVWSLQQLCTCEYSGITCEPLLPTYNATPSTTLAREILEDLPTKMTFSSRRDLDAAIQNLTAYIDKCIEYSRSNGFSDEDDRELRHTCIEHEHKLAECANVDDVSALYTELKKAIGIIIRKQTKVIHNINQISLDLSKLSDEYASAMKSWTSVGPAPQHVIKVDASKTSCNIQYGELKEYLGDAHLRKLARLWNSCHTNDASATKIVYKDLNMPVTFFNNVLALLVRYNLSTGQSGANLHASVPSRVMMYIRDNMHVMGECFASPLNSFFEYYHSAYSDVDSQFGSKGSFFVNTPTEGMYQANPPFVEEVVDLMCQRMNTAMASDKPLGFIVFVPDWNDSQALSNIIACRYHRTNRVLRSGNHCYLSGYSHLSDKLFSATHNTRVILLQNDAGSAKYPISDDVFDNLVSVSYQVEADKTTKRLVDVTPAQTKKRRTR